MRPMKAIDQSMNYRMSGEITLRPDKTYVVEPKIDGVRAFIEFDDHGKPALIVATSGNAVRHNLLRDVPTMPELAGTVLDGELTIPNQPLGTLVGALNASQPKPILDRACFYAFDLLSAMDRDVRGLPLDQRLRALDRILKRLAEDSPYFIRRVTRERIAGNEQDQVVAFAKGVERSGFEGIMIKDAASIYSDGRSKSWIKVKWLSSIDCFVTGWEPGEGGYTNMVGSLQMSVYNEHGEPVEICSHGVFDLAFRQALTNEHGNLDPSWYGKVMEITFQSAGTDRRLRHPRLLRLRPDRGPHSCTLDQLEQP